MPVSASPRPKSPSSLGSNRHRSGRRTANTARRTGVLQEQQLRQHGLLPSSERMAQGPVAIIECIEEIPCNPCVDACPKKAIKIEGSIICQPSVDFAACNGCGTCVARCPGLAIFIVNMNYRATEASVALPYEFLPRPTPGSTVQALDRAGRIVCQARVERVLDSKALDRCAVVTVAVPKRFGNRVRGIRLPQIQTKVRESGA
ncbi:MAG: 4Fe-4S binding protein [candidate division WOR-3 bacterium]